MLKLNMILSLMLTRPARPSFNFLLLWWKFPQERSNPNGKAFLGGERKAKANY